LDRRLGGPQSRSERGGEEKNSDPIPGIEPPIIQPVAQRYTAELSRLLPKNMYNIRVVKIKNEMGEARSAHERSEMHIKIWSVKLNGRNHLEHQGIHGKIFQN
jgi:hypothetical protein